MLSITLRDRFFCGLQEIDLTFERATSLTLAMEMAQRDAQGLQEKPDVQKQTRPSNNIKGLGRLTKSQSSNLVKKNVHNACRVVKIITRARAAFTLRRHATHVTRRATFQKYASQILTMACMKLKSKTSSFISRRDPPN